jgi:polyhydroxybutyrate depolymerase
MAIGNTMSAQGGWRLPWRLLLAAAVLLTAACADGGGEGAPSGPVPEGKPSLRPSPGCSSPDSALYQAAGSSQVRQLTVEGTAREVRVYLPRSLRPEMPAPLVYNFHGLGSSALAQEVYSGLVPLAEREGFVLVSPNGIGSPRGWRVPALVEGQPDPERDLRFFDALHREVAGSLCIDLGRVYATGMSNGAFFSSALACARPQVVAAVAPVAGVFYPPQGCQAPVPMLAFHGTDDRIVPYRQGLIFNVIPYAGAEAYVDAWARLNGCAPSPALERLGSEVVRRAYQGCQAATVLVAVEGGGHTWPGARLEDLIGRATTGQPGSSQTPIPASLPDLGHTTVQVSAAEMMWAFFRQHARAG